MIGTKNQCNFLTNVKEKMTVMQNQIGISLSKCLGPAILRRQNDVIRFLYVLVELPINGILR